MTERLTDQQTWNKIFLGGLAFIFLCAALSMVFNQPEPEPIVFQPSVSAIRSFGYNECHESHSDRACVDIQRSAQRNERFMEQANNERMRDYYREEMVKDLTFYNTGLRAKD